MLLLSKATRIQSLTSKVASCPLPTAQSPSKSARSSDSPVAFWSLPLDWKHRWKRFCVSGQGGGCCENPSILPLQVRFFLVGVLSNGQGMSLNEILRPEREWLIGSINLIPLTQGLQPWRKSRWGEALEEISVGCSSWLRSSSSCKCPSSACNVLPSQQSAKRLPAVTQWSDLLQRCICFISQYPESRLALCARVVCCWSNCEEQKSSCLHPDSRPMRAEQILPTNQSRGGGQQNLGDSDHCLGPHLADSQLVLCCYRRTDGGRAPHTCTTSSSLLGNNVTDSFCCKLCPTLCKFQMLYYFDLELVHAFIFIVPCVLFSLFKVRVILVSSWIFFKYKMSPIFQIWTKLVAKSQAEIISKKLNEELVKLV